MNFNQCNDDIDVYSLCESVYYSCNNDEYDYVLECVNDWIMNGYNDNILLEDIVLNEAVGFDKLITYLARDFARRFPNKTEEEFYKMMEIAPHRRYSRATDKWYDTGKYEEEDFRGATRLYNISNLNDLLNRLNDKNVARKFKSIDSNKTKNNYGYRLLDFYRRYVSRALNKHKGYYKLEVDYPELTTKNGKFITNKFKNKAFRDDEILANMLFDDSISTRYEYDGVDSDNSPIKIKSSKRNRDNLQLRHNELRRRFLQGSLDHPLQPATAATPKPERKVETKQQDTSTPPVQPTKEKTKPVTKQEPSKPETPPLQPATAATPKPVTKQEPSKPQPPKVVTPQSRLSRFTNYMKNNKGKIGLGVGLGAAAIGGSIYAYKRFKNKPRSVIAKRIQALRGVYHKFMINAQRNPQKANVFKRIAAKILSVIDKLLHYLQNKADGR